MSTLCLIVLAIAGLTAVSSAELCTGLEVMKCQPLVENSKKKLLGGWMETNEDLQELCSNERALLGCLYEHIEPCDDVYNPNMAIYLKEELQLYDVVCKEGEDLHSKYLKHAKCMNEHDSTVESKCGPIRQFENPANIEEDCKTFEKGMSCYLAEAEKSCGADARDFVTVISKPSANFVINVCKK